MEQGPGNKLVSNVKILGSLNGEITPGGVPLYQKGSGVRIDSQDTRMEWNRHVHDNMELSAGKGLYQLGESH